MAAQPLPVFWAPGARHLDLTENPARLVHDVRISPGVTTAFRFHGASIDPERVVLEGRERMWVAVADDAILLVPSEQAVPGENLRLTVPFKDSALPRTANFMLVVHPAVAERQVEVYSKRRPAESLGVELKEKDAQLKQCREKVELLRAELKHPDGLTGLLATAQLDKMGVIPKVLLKDVVRQSGIPLRVNSAMTFRSNMRVAVALWLEGSEEVGPWIPEGVALRSNTGEELKGLTMWQDFLDESKTRLHVVVEADATDTEAHGTFILNLWDASGLRTFTFNNVTFP